MAAAAAGVAVFLKEYSEQQERLDRDAHREADQEARSGGRRLPLPWA